MGWWFLRIALSPDIVMLTAVEARNFVLHIGHLGRRELRGAPDYPKAREVALEAYSSAGYGGGHLDSNDGDCCGPDVRCRKKNKRQRMRQWAGGRKFPKDHGDSESGGAPVLRDHRSLN